MAAHKELGSDALAAHLGTTSELRDGAVATFGYQKISQMQILRDIWAEGARLGFLELQPGRNS